MIASFIYFTVGALALLAGLLLGAASERRRAVQIADRILYTAPEPTHEFWKGYAAAAQAVRLQIGGGAR